MLAWFIRKSDLLKSMIYPYILWAACPAKRLTDAISIKKELFARGAKWFLWKSEVFGETAGWGTDKAAKWL